MNKQRVLVVDDDRSLAEATSKLLNGLDYQTTISNTLDSAEAELTSDTYFDLVVLDLDLGGGAQATYDLLDRLASRKIAVPRDHFFRNTERRSSTRRGENRQLCVTAETVFG